MHCDQYHFLNTILFHSLTAYILPCILAAASKSLIPTFPHNYEVSLISYYACYNHEQVEIQPVTIGEKILKFRQKKLFRIKFWRAMYSRLALLLSFEHIIKFSRNRITNGINFNLSPVENEKFQHSLFQLPSCPSLPSSEDL